MPTLLKTVLISQNLLQFLSLHAHKYTKVKLQFLLITDINKQNEAEHGKCHSERQAEVNRLEKAILSLRLGIMQKDFGGSNGAQDIAPAFSVKSGTSLGIDIERKSKRFLTNKHQAWVCSQKDMLWASILTLDKRNHHATGIAEKLQTAPQSAWQKAHQKSPSQRPTDLKKE